jgi:hypothetical protein
VSARDYGAQGADHLRPAPPLSSTAAALRRSLASPSPLLQFFDRARRDRAALGQLARSWPEAPGL